MLLINQIYYHHAFQRRNNRQEKGALACRVEWVPKCLPTEIHLAAG
jgi:hypothetical protein